MRKSFDGLAAEVRSRLGEDPVSGHWFAFINRRGTQIKVLAFEAGGYCLWSKRLEVGQFARLGRDVDIKRALQPTEFLALLEGVDMMIKKQRKRYPMMAAA
jgi:transposase